MIFDNLDLRLSIALESMHTMLLEQYVSIDFLPHSSEAAHSNCEVLFDQRGSNKNCLVTVWYQPKTENRNVRFHFFKF